MEELKPCPFCGGKARMHVAFASGGDHSVGIYVECLECRSCSGTKWGDGAQEKAADAWNRRANDCDREYLLALADELGSYEDGDCEECIAYGQPECKGHLSCAETIARYSARKMREAVERDGEGATTVSAYDLLSDEDREALAWVREMGGVEAAKASIHQGAMEHGCLLKVAEMLGTSIYDGTGNADALLDKLEKRLMPAGCEWPRFEDGEPVKLRDVIVPPEGGEPREVDCINHFKDCWYIGLAGASSERLKRGERVNRPTVLAADGEPLEAGQTVWDVGNGVEFTVIGLPNPGEYQAVKLRLDDGAFTGLDPDRLTHKRPVLDADGVPIKEGDTVYEVGENHPPFIVGCLPKPGAYRSVKVVYPSGAFTFLDPERLTHAKPEPPDSWERVEEDATKNPFDYCKDVGHRLDTCENSEAHKARDLVRRCRALAERGER